MTRTDTTVEYSDAWDALESSPPTAANLRLRARLMIAVSEEVTGRRLARTKAAATLGISSTRLAQLMEGEIDVFSVDELVAIADRAGLAVDMTIAPRAA